MSVLFANNDNTTIAVSINTTATSVSLAPGTGALFPNPTGGDYFMLTFIDLLTGLQNEIVKVTARVGDVCTIVRAQEGTAAQSWNAGDLASGLVTAGGLQSFMQQSNNRTRLFANTTFYVSPTGSDVTGDGTSGNPWATAFHAYNVLATSYDLNGFVATIFRNAGSYTDQVTCYGFLVGQNKNNQLIFDGAGMGSVTVTCAGPNFQAIGSTFTVQNQKLIQTVNFTLTSGVGGLIQVQNIDFGTGAVGGNHIAATGGGQIDLIGNYQISGNCAAHWSCDDGGAVNGSGITITLVGTPAFANAFGVAVRCGVIQLTGANITFSGSATGSRYSVVTNGVIDTQGKGATYLPGNAAGTTTTGGQYT